MTSNMRDMDMDVPSWATEGGGTGITLSAAL